MAPQAYVQMQVLQQAIAATNTLDDSKLAGYIRATTFHAALGDVTFGKDGEWAEGRALKVQFRNVSGNDPLQFKDTTMQVVGSPPSHASGEVVYPTRRRSNAAVRAPAQVMASRQRRRHSRSHQGRGAIELMVGTSSGPANLRAVASACARSSSSRRSSALRQLSVTR